MDSRPYVVLVMKYYQSAPQGIREVIRCDDLQDALAECRFQRGLAGTTSIVMASVESEEDLPGLGVDPASGVYTVDGR